jgi:heme-degrading monooxygenase HmoA
MYVLLVYQFREEPTMSILREWRAEIRRATSAAYVEYVRATGIVEYRRTPGNLGAVVAVRDIDETRSEIVTLSWWTSLEAIRAFAGDSPDRARYFPDDDQYLLTRPDHVQHYRSSDLG